MKTWFASMLLGVWLIDQCVAQVGYESTTTNTYLVGGTVTEVKAPNAKGIAALTIRVDAVYSGPENLIGLSFEDLAANGKWVSYNSLASPIPIPEKGTKGVWALRRKNQAVVPSLVFDGVDRRWPSMPNFDKRYRQAELLAQAIKSAELHVVPEEKVNTLLGYALSDVPEISQWATKALFDANREGLLSEGTVPRAGLPVAGKLVVDELFAGRRGESWTKSQARFDLLLSIAETKKDEYEGMLVVRRLEIIAQRKSDMLPSDVFVAIASRIACNKGDSLKGRVEALDVLRFPVRLGDTNAVEVLINQFDTGIPEMEKMAARLLRLNAVLTEKQKLLLSEIKQKGGYPGRADDIDAILNKK